VVYTRTTFDRANLLCIAAIFPLRYDNHMYAQTVRLSPDGCRREKMDFIRLDRPLVIFDIESTGLNIKLDRIIELAAIRVMPDGGRESRCWLLNPGIPIPLESTAIHGITNEIVADCPHFGQVLDEIEAFFRGADLGGFNHTRFDIPLLAEEFSRAGLAFDAASRRIFDAQRIFHSKMPRDLPAALEFYCDGAELPDEPDTMESARAALKVFAAQLQRYSELPQSVAELDGLLNQRDPFDADRAGRLRWVEGEITINFGKNQGKKLRDLVQEDVNYLEWIIRSDFPLDTRTIVQNALEGSWPAPPPAVVADRGAQ